MLAMRGARGKRCTRRIGPGAKGLLGGCRAGKRRAGGRYEGSAAGVGGTVEADDARADVRAVGRMGWEW